MPRQLYAEPALPCTPFGIEVLFAGREAALAAEEDHDTEDERDYESSSSNDSSWEDALSAPEDPDDVAVAAAVCGPDLQPDKVDPWDAFDNYVSELDPPEDYLAAAAGELADWSTEHVAGEDYIPAMPVVPNKRKHQSRDAGGTSSSF